ncbi:hypothetical protein G6F46_009804 [Rhizopus delemar]|uniref:Plasma membrane fusion protein PRM1 n=3 Tax=Rhizopus TaxID=4842 RepID=I1CKK5_RHIO9|nr:hypothetical protein RO3G_13696 [Rhizopus delemar RA 99-880]KAG1454834.1 hypothetical protein G6F55_007398 [Rhizopus delemar]KAG1538207.1 hypothetical protein G6F51_009909 [Rhizopus arrhizus]KAG1492370.1 hypothetical protein G6F54_009361 [Rhizopus delemar]KAG1506553.1 hypothetical protein G6F53_009605 [Rhizopus delemar]|eukprot:EIE88985.1 hypothetical protein RO3G_13696 [Rhizopus delemar RA 99-880]
MLFSLQEEYALAWLHLSTISIITILIHLSQALSRLSQGADASKARIESACSTLDSIASQLFNAPHVLLVATQSAIQTTKENVHHALSAALTVIKTTLVWFIQLYKSIFRCLLGLPVHTLLSLLTQVAGPIQKATEDIASVLTGSNHFLGNWTQGLQGISDRLDHWVQQEDDWVQQMVSMPLDAIQIKLNQSLGDWEPAPAPVLGKSQTVCDTAALEDAVDRLYAQATSSVWWMMGLLVLCLALSIALQAYSVKRKHQRIQTARDSLLAVLSGADSEKRPAGPELLERYERTVQFPLLFARLQSRCRFLGVMSRPVAIDCLLVGLTGIVLLHAFVYVLESKTRRLSQDFSNQVIAWTNHTTSHWATEAGRQLEEMNDWVHRTEVDLNEHLFDTIKSTALGMNHTLSSVMGEVQEAIGSILGGTLLEQPAQGLVQCLVTNKVENIENGLTWIASHAYIHLTKMDITSFHPSSVVPKLTETMLHHLQVDDGSSSASLRTLLGFYYTLLLFWLLTIVIATGFQIKHRQSQ